MKLLVLPNDLLRDYRRSTTKEFLDLINSQRLFDEVRFLGWEEDYIDEFAGVKAYPFLNDRSKNNIETLLKRLKSGEIPFTSPLFRPILLDNIERIESFLKEFKPSLIRTFNADLAAELGGIIKELTQIPLVISMYDPSRVTSAIHYADSLVCESHELKGICESQYGFPSERIKVIHNGIDLDVFSPKSQDEISRIVPNQFLDAQYKILSVSRVVRGKNIETLLKSISLIKEELPGLVHLHLGSSNLEIEKLRKELGLEQISYFLDPRQKNETPAFYSWADVFVLPSLWEGLSRAVRESLACGTPAVVTNYGSSTEIVQHNYNGLLVDPNNPEDIAQNLSTILRDNYLRKRLSLKARSSINRYDVASSVRMHEENYRSLLKIQ